MKETIKIILWHKIDLALIVLFGFGFVIGVINNAPTITSGSCLFAIGNVTFNLANKVRLIKSGVLDKLEELKNEMDNASSNVTTNNSTNKTTKR